MYIIQYGLYDLKYRVSADYDFLLKLYLAGAQFAASDTIVAFFSKAGFSEKNKWIFFKDFFTSRYNHGDITKWAMLRGIFSSRLLYSMEHILIWAGKLFSSR